MGGCDLLQAGRYERKCWSWARLKQGSSKDPRIRERQPLGQPQEPVGGPDGVRETARGT